MENYLLSALFFVLLLLSAFFSASETALTGANRLRLRAQSEQPHAKSAKRALLLIEKYDKTLAALLVGNNIVNISAATVSTVVFTSLVGPQGIGLATAFTTVIVIVFGEVLPKSIANDHSESFLKAASLPLQFVATLFTPFVFLLTVLKKAARRNSTGQDPSITEDELKLMIEEIEDEGVIEEDRSELLQSALEFNDITVQEILTPRVDIFALEEGCDKQVVLDMFLQQKFTRVPIYRGKIDNIIGVINQKDFYAAVIQNTFTTVHELLQPCLYVPPKKKISELMTQLQRTKLHIAVVTDQYGGTLGIVTLEDILEQLVGEIWDEHDEVVELINPLGDGSYEVSGELEIEDLYDALAPDAAYPDVGSASLAGYALEVFGHIPEVGEMFEDAQFVYTVTQVQDQRIVKLQCVIKG